MTIKYTKDHEWISIEGEIATLGITSHAADALGELVYVELPEVGDESSKGDAIIVVESSKSASDVYTPISGKIAEVNEVLNDEPNKVNDFPLADGWIVKIKFSDIKEIDELMDEDEYSKYIKEES
jgi:glycine cleavage system H protein